MKSLCDGCGEDFTISHALDCKKGGLVAHRHNDFRDLNIDLLTKSGLTQVIEEPVLKESCVNGEDGLRELTGAHEVFGNLRGKHCLIAAFLMLTPLHIKELP